MADSKTETSFQSIPTTDVIENIAQLQVYDPQGNQVLLGSLFEGQKAIVVFIRHFFCGICQQYVTQLASVRRQALEQAGTRLVVVGCGDWQLIKHYCETTGFSGEIYADPSRDLYRALGLIANLNRTPGGQEKRSYLLGRSTLGNVLKSIWDGPLKNPQYIGKQGNISQLGGDFIFGPGTKCEYASRMKHTEDHVEVKELMREAGVTYP